MIRIAITAAAFEAATLPFGSIMYKAHLTATGKRLMCAVSQSGTISG